MIMETPMDKLGLYQDMQLSKLPFVDHCKGCEHDLFKANCPFVHTVHGHLSPAN